MISVQHLTKSYGEVSALDDLSFEIDEGGVYGFLGPNGAGKSTTMNIITGCLSTSSGEVAVGGVDIYDEPKKAKQLIGYLPENPPLYLSETPTEYLRFVGQAKGLRGEALQMQIDDVIRRTGLTKMRNRRIAALSKGYKQRVGIAQALIGDPQVVILDEPTIGLDPHQIIEIRHLIRELGARHTVIFSSHILSEVQALCDRILVISSGRLVAFDTPDNLERSLVAPGHISLTLDAADEELPRLLELVSAVPGVGSVEPRDASDGYPSLRVHSVRSAADVGDARTNDLYGVSRRLFRACADADVAILEMSLSRTTLEDVFLKLTGGETLPSDGEPEDVTGGDGDTGVEPAEADS